jgi:hypothetical protein
MSYIYRAVKKTSAGEGEKVRGQQQQQQRRPVSAASSLDEANVDSPDSLSLQERDNDDSDNDDDEIGSEQFDDDDDDDKDVDYSPGSARRPSSEYSIRYLTFLLLKKKTTTALGYIQ